MSIENGGRVQTDVIRPGVQQDSENALEPNQFWTRSAHSHVGGCSCCSTKEVPGKVAGKDGAANLYQFSGDGNKAGLPAVEVKDNKAGHGAGCGCCTGKGKDKATTGDKTESTYKVRKDDSLWTVASKLVDKSDLKDKSDKLKLDVVKGLVEKNKGQYKGLEANPDKIIPGQVLKIDSVKALAELGHGKKLNSTYKPEEKQQERVEKKAPPVEQGEKRKVTEAAPKVTQRVERETSDPAARLQQPQRLERERQPIMREDAREYAGHSHDHNPALLRPERQFEPQRQHADLGPMKDVLGMIGMIAGGALRGGMDNGHRHHHFGGRPRDFYEERMPRGYYDMESSRGYYDQGRNERYQPYQHPHQMRNQYRMSQNQRYEQPRPFFL